MHRKNADAVTNANYVVFDGLNTLAQRQGDLFKTTVDDYTKVTRDLLVGASFEERACKRADATRDIYVSAVARLRELSDIAVNTNVTAADILNARVSEAFDEFRALLAASRLHPYRDQRSADFGRRRARRSLKKSPPSRTWSPRSRPSPPSPPPRRPRQRWRHRPLRTALNAAPEAVAPAAKARRHSRPTPGRVGPSRNIRRRCGACLGQHQRK